MQLLAGGALNVEPEMETSQVSVVHDVPFSDESPIVTLSFYLPP